MIFKRDLLHYGKNWAVETSQEASEENTLSTFVKYISSLEDCCLSGFNVTYRDADKSLARPTSRCILFDG
jgi:hypothetical protein